MNIFPVFYKETNVHRTPVFAALRHTSVSGREVRAALMSYPLRRFDLNFNVIQDESVQNVYKTLEGFFLQQQGSLTAFLYTDPGDYSVTDQNFGTGDGVTAAFQLARTFGANGATFAEPVMNVNAITAIKDGASTIPQGAGAGKYTVSASGVVTFGTIPTAGHALTWTGTYYYKVRFDDDLADFEHFAKQLWRWSKCSFTGATGNKV